MTTAAETAQWAQRIDESQVVRYMTGDRDFIDDDNINETLRTSSEPGPRRVDEILAKSLAVETLTLEEAAALLRVQDPDVWARMRAVGAEVKRRVYDNRIVTFAPLYLSNRCVNDCSYCGLRRSNTAMTRRTLTLDEVKRETAVLAGEIGHKRLIAVYGEHPAFDVHYMVDTLRAIYETKTTTPGGGRGEIRRVNVNAAPQTTEDLKVLAQAGLGTFQVFQETYHHDTYARVHPPETMKGDYRWRLYAMHRALETEVIDDVGLGVLFGLYDWRFEVLGLLTHNIELEARFGIGAHTISFPRLEPAANTPFLNHLPYRVSDDDFVKLVTVLRLAIPHAGMIVTAREPAEVRRRVLPLGCTQTDASTKIGIGAYSDPRTDRDDHQQFVLGDPRSLDEVVRELADNGCITSFCTAGYRCGRTGRCIMELLRSGAEGKFCKLNAVLTYREWLDDFASPDTRSAGLKVLEAELEEVRANDPRAYPRLMESYNRIVAGERDLFF